MWWTPDSRPGFSANIDSNTFYKMDDLQVNNQSIGNIIKDYYIPNNCAVLTTTSYMKKYSQYWSLEKEMVSLQIVRTHTKSLEYLGARLVAIFGLFNLRHTFSIFPASTNK
jgi:hypothetical protein